jgi:hypothetical protein
MAERKQGVHKTEQEKAQELLDRQTKLVSRLEETRDQYQAKLTEVDHQLGQERDLLAYYEKHPLLMTINVEDHEEELPLTFAEEHSRAMQDDIGEARARQSVAVGGKQAAWKGFPGKHAAE